MIKHTPTYVRYGDYQHGNSNMSTEIHECPYRTSSEIIKNGTCTVPYSTVRGKRINTTIPVEYF